MPGRFSAALAIFWISLSSMTAAGEAEPSSTGVNGTFSSSGATKLQGIGPLTFRLGGMSYGADIWYSQVVPEPIAYAIEAKGARIELWETIEYFQSPFSNEDWTPDGHRMLASIPFSGTLRFDVASPTSDTIHVLAPAVPRENPYYASEALARTPRDVNISLTPETAFSASLDGPDPDGRAPSAVHWSSNPGNQSLDVPVPTLPARIAFERAHLQGPLVGLFLGGKIVSEGPDPREWQTGVSRFPGGTSLPGGLTAATRYQYLMLHADEAVLEFPQDSHQWSSHVRGLGGSMSGDAIWQGVNGTVRYGADQSTYRSESLQVIGTLSLALEWPFNDQAMALTVDDDPWSTRKPNEDATWSVAGEASFVAVDTQTQFGSRFLLVSVAGLAVLTAAAVALAQGKSLAVALLGRSTRDVFPVVLASPCRRRMLRELLSGWPVRVYDLAAALGKTPSTIRFHARVLKAHGLIQELRSSGGRRAAYRLGDPRTAGSNGGPLLVIFGNPRRRGVYDLLRAKGPLGVADLGALLKRERGRGISRSALSRHLAELVASGVVTERWQDRRKVYSVQEAPAPADGLAAWCIARLGLRPIADTLQELGPLDVDQAARAVTLPSGNGPRAIRQGLDYLVDLGVADRQGTAYRLIGPKPGQEAQP